jgi:cell division septation protein DedD
MKNNTFTYLLYALLGLLILFGGYLAIEHKKEQTRKAEEMAKDQEQLTRSIGENAVIDTTAGKGSAYVGDKPTTPVADKNGIEQDGPAQPTAAPAPAPGKAAPTATQPTPTTAKPIAPKPVAPTATAPTGTQAPKITTGGTTSPKSIAPPAPSGRYHVVAGVFSQVANARSEMERMVKMGYRDAEVVKVKEGVWRVVVHRAKSRQEAEQYEADLERHGVDAQIKDTASK